MKHLWKKRLPAGLLALVLALGVSPVAGARSTTLTVEVDAGDTVKLDRRDFAQLFEDLAWDTDLDYITFTKYTDLEDFGQFTAEDDKGNDCTLDEDNLQSVWFHYNERDIEHAGDCDLDTLSFEADRDADGTLALEFTMVGQDTDESYKSTLYIEVDGDGRGSHHSKGDLDYKVDGNREVRFKRDDFKAYYDADRGTRGNMVHLAFTNFDDLDDFGHFTAADVTGTRQTLHERNLSSNTWFYYDSNRVSGSDYALDTLIFEADKNAKGVLELDFRLTGVSGTKQYTCEGTVTISMDKSSTPSASDDTLTWTLDAGETVSLDRRSFRDLFRADRRTRGDLDYVTFPDAEDLDDYGYFTATSKEGKTVTLTEDNLENVWFHYDDITYKTDCDLNTLTFHASKNVKGTLKLDVRLVGEDSDEKVSAQVELKIGGKDAPASKKGDINYQAVTREETEFDEDDFADYFDKAYDGDRSEELHYVEFRDSEGLNRSNGRLYFRYDTRHEEEFSHSSLRDYTFYHSDYEDNYEDDRDAYALDDLSFLVDEDFEGPVVLEFRAYGSRSSRYVDGTLVIAAGDPDKRTSGGADIQYATTSTAPVSLVPADFVRFLRSKIPGAQLAFVTLDAAPKEGSLYYDNNGVLKELTDAVVRSQIFVQNSANATEYALGKVSYIPYGTNYSTEIPFTVYSTRLEAVKGTIVISSTLKKMAEVYGPVNKNATVSFPVPPISAAVKNATGLELSGIRLLQLPEPKVGTIVAGGGGVSVPADTKTIYGVNSGDWRMSQLRFTPAQNYTGPVDIPYAAYDKDGKVIGSGVLSLGVVEQIKSFKDLPTSTWCYKYVSQLAGNNIISGYKDKTFKEKNPLTWGAALKLICLANDTGKQGDSFETFLTLARQKGWVTANKVNLSKTITRQEFCQVAAKAMGLDLTKVPSVSPFTDTSDPAVLALNAAGIIGGYSDGTFLPNKALTRGHISAIVWRMDQYQ